LPIGTLCRSVSKMDVSVDFIRNGQEMFIVVLDLLLSTIFNFRDDFLI
jgi:hypothetical protein